MGSRLTASGTDRVYAAAQLWVDRALRSDDSLLTPGNPIWSSRWLREIRRRFYFFNFFPDKPPIKGLLRRWLETNNSDLQWVADLVDQANQDLGDRHLGIGPSHFMKEDPPLDEDRVQFIWEQAVIPYIEEQFFGNEERIKEFDYDHLRQELDKNRLPEAGAGNGSG